MNKKIDLGKLTEEDTMELAQDCVELLTEENQWIIFKKLAEELGIENCQAELEELADKE